MDQLDLRKKQVLDLVKSKGIEDIEARVILALDFSGSMTSLYRNGVVQETIERILPIGMALDKSSNASVDFFLFEDNYRMLQPLTRTNINGYIDRKVWGKYDMGGTAYSPVMEGIANLLKIDLFPKKKTGGLLSKLFGSTELDSNPPIVTFNKPVYVIFMTDGANSDEERTSDIIRAFSRFGVFWKFTAIGNLSMQYLEELDTLKERYMNIDNTHFFRVPNLTKTTDDELYNLLLAEFPAWITAARQHKLII